MTSITVQATGRTRSHGRPGRLPLLTTSSAVLPTGPGAGEPCTLLTFTSCPLGCLGCYSASAFERKHPEYTTKAPEKLVLREPDGPVVLTGNDPLMWYGSAVFCELLEILTDLDLPVHLHTRGNQLCRPVTSGLRQIDHFRISPPFGPRVAAVDYSGPEVDVKIVSEWRAAAVAGLAHFHFEARTDMDVCDAGAFARAHRIPAELVWITYSDALSRKNTKLIRDAAKGYGFMVAAPQ